MTLMSFRMNKLIKIREHREKELQYEYAEVCRNLRHHCELRENIRDRKISAFRKTIQFLDPCVQPSLIVMVRGYVAGLDRELMEVGERIEGLETARDAKYSRLLEAVQEKKKIERLREKFTERQIREEILDERKRIDEVAVVHYQRKRGNP